MEIKEGDLLCNLNYFTVVRVDDKLVQFKDVSDGQEWAIPLKHIGSITNHWSASFYNKIEAVSRTTAVHKMSLAGIRPFTVAYIKQNSEDREMRGIFIKAEPTMGRTLVKDLDAKEDAIKSVDNRTIKYLILDGVKYEVHTN